MHEPFAEVALLLLLAAAAGAFATWLRQPVLIAYICVGIAVGPAGAGLVTAHDQIDLLAQFGVAVLLFLVGLQLDLKNLREIGPVALATGLGQIAFTVAIGFALILALGRDWLTALYVAVALTFSSTIIIVKLLSDKRELDSLHGRIAVGFLIVQDLAVVVAMTVMSALRGAGEGTARLDAVVGTIGLRVVVAGALLALMMRYVLPRLMQRIARSQELLLVFALAWGATLAALGDAAGFSKEAGALVAGFSLASTPFRDAIGARLAGIRDFMLPFFFIDLGARLDFSTLGAEVLTTIVLSVFVLVGNPLIVMAIMGAMGYRRRTSFMAGLTVAQISEFSIIFVAMGVALGHVGVDALGLTTLVGVVTIALSTYLILYSRPIFDRLAPMLGPFERRHPYRELAVERAGADGMDPPQVVIFGLGRYGERLLARLERSGVRTLGVDFDPETVRRLQRQGRPVRYGDAEDAVFVGTLPLGGARWIVTTLPTREGNRALLAALRAATSSGRIAGVVRDDAHAKALHAAGVDHVINPFHDAADHAAQTIAEAIAREKEQR